MSSIFLRRSLGGVEAFIESRLELVRLHRSVLLERGFFVETGSSNVAGAFNGWLCCYSAIVGRLHTR